MDHLKKIFTEFVTALLLFHVGFFFGLEAGRIFASHRGIKLLPSALEGEVLTTEPPGSPRSDSLTIVASP